NRGAFCLGIFLRYFRVDIAVLKRGEVCPQARKPASPQAVRVPHLSETRLYNILREFTNSLFPVARMPIAAILINFDI
ncbi:MAG: hypothetical protein ACMG55_19345, partial [Microcoleus sp.]